LPSIHKPLFPSLSYSAAVFQSFSFLFSLSVKIFKKKTFCTGV
jgi:hypothetical protein